MNTKPNNDEHQEDYRLAAIARRDADRMAKGLPFIPSKPLSPSERGKLGGRPKGSKGKPITSDRARELAAARWAKYRAQKQSQLVQDTIKAWYPPTTTTEGVNK